MHLLAAAPGSVLDGSQAIDLGQSPGELVLLSAADTELAALAAAYARLEGAVPTLRLANLKQLTHNLSVDLYVESVVRHARLVIVRLLGGVGYWPYGVERLAALAREGGISLACLPGDDQPDAELASLSTLEPAACRRLWRYALEGGAENARNLLATPQSSSADDQAWREPAPLLHAGLYWPARARPTLEDVSAHWLPAAPVAALVFYRALVQAADLLPIDRLITALAARGLNPLPLFVASLKEPLSAALIAELFAAAAPDIILNATGFAVASPGAGRKPAPFDGADCAVLQLVLSGGNEAEWRAGKRGLSARDLAMNVALPEVDGRILSRAVSFKGERHFDNATQCSIVVHTPLADRIAFVAELAAAWVRLRRTPARERRVAVMLANYPNRDGRVGNGVGLDTPAGTLKVLEALAAAGYRVEGAPADGKALVERLLAGPTNDLRDRGARLGGVRFPLAAYEAWFAGLPSPCSMPCASVGARPRAIPSSRTMPSAWRHSRLATSSSASSRRAATTSIRSRPITTRHWSRRTAISPSMPGSGPRSTCMPSSTWASTAISNGCRGRRWRSPPNASPRSPWARSRTSIPSSSTTPARAARPSGAQRR